MNAATLMGLGKFNCNNLSVTSNFTVIEKNRLKKV